MSEPPPPVPPPQSNTTTVPQPILTTPYPTTPYHRQFQPQIHHHLPTSPNLREYRKGNWTLEETLVLITAKRLDDERRINNAAAPNSSRAIGELRWKWVENYCWNNGCLRSQNQCNDKWDNLLRDYKKVREHEVSLSSSSNCPSYWKMDKNQRKDRNLPSNLILKIYEALNEVVQRKYPSSQTRPTLSIQSPPMTMLPPPPPPPPPPQVAAALGNSALQIIALLKQFHFRKGSGIMLVKAAGFENSEHIIYCFSSHSFIIPELLSDSSETNGSEEEEDQSLKVDPETKRRRVRDIESSIVQSTSVLAQTLVSCEEKREKRHKEIMEMEEQRLRIEESRTEMNRQGISSLIASVNNLSTAIHALISDRRDKG